MRALRRSASIRLWEREGGNGRHRSKRFYLIIMEISRHYLLSLFKKFHEKNIVYQIRRVLPYRFLKI